ncbi:phosphopantetheine-binding protein [Pararoseomonas indoligenes]|uniref:Phosphopantetheine-binding protein n=1 Tax=Roseomonas indoligenes TaxID=2820811 RepID=A0A940MZ50_9PROT|nr:phosphopantetheine-binding protein [Pararoseomonas indoligenes]MBP0494841.1 phosphopantetheine-binding protein [Pararoseomonas indoligenes]
MADGTNPPMTRERMRADIARALRMDPEEVGGDDDLNDLGLDSMRAMNMVLRWTEGGLQLDFGELAERLTLNAWWAVAERATEKRANG